MGKYKVYKKGERVTIIINGGEQEGVATLVKEIKNVFNDYPAWKVLFDGEDETPVNRTIYPQEEG